MHPRVVAVLQRASSAPVFFISPEECSEGEAAVLIENRFSLANKLCSNKFPFGAHPAGLSMSCSLLAPVFHLLIFLHILFSLLEFVLAACKARALQFRACSLLFFMALTVSKAEPAAELKSLTSAFQVVTLAV